MALQGPDGCSAGRRHLAQCLASSVVSRSYLNLLGLGFSICKISVTVPSLAHKVVVGTEWDHSEAQREEGLNPCIITAVFSLQHLGFSADGEGWDLSSQDCPCHPKVQDLGRRADE